MGMILLYGLYYDLRLHLLECLRLYYYSKSMPSTMHFSPDIRKLRVFAICIVVDSYLFSSKQTHFHLQDADSGK